MRYSDYTNSAATAAAAAADHTRLKQQKSDATRYSDYIPTAAPDSAPALPLPATPPRN